MFKHFLLIVALILPLAISCQGKEGTESKKSKESTKLSIALKWQLKDGKTEQKILASPELSSLDRKGLWVAFKKDGENFYPGVSIGGKFLKTDAHLNRISALELLVTLVKNGSEKLTERSILFSEERPVGTKELSPKNIYHLLVLNGFVDASALPSSLGEKEAPAPEWEEPFFRTHRLAMNYAVQSDEKTQEFAKGLEVKASYRLPRLILVAEEEHVVAIEAKNKGSQEGLFGIDIAGKIAGEDDKAEKKVDLKSIPIYSIDLMHDDITSEGKYSAGFQNARSLWNDILEGKVIYEASEGKRRVITTTIVFSQMQKNIATRNSSNQLLKIDADSSENLDKCDRLLPSVKKDILGFLKDHPEWDVIIPQKPVAFYKDNKPIYDIYAWYGVHPASGRMMGVLSNSMRGGTSAPSAISDEAKQLEGKLVEKGKEAATKVAGASGILAFGQQIAGLYVAAGGIIEGITITFCNPEIAALSEAEWRKFLSTHALDYSVKFMEEHAEFYDDYVVMICFWQGAITMASLVGGIDAAEEGFYRALDMVLNKAKTDATNLAEEKLDELKEGVTGEIESITDEAINNVIDEAMGEHAEEVVEWVEAVNRAKEITDKVTDTAEKVQEAKARFDATRDEIKDELRSRGFKAGGHYRDL